MCIYPLHTCDVHIPPPIHVMCMYPPIHVMCMYPPIHVMCIYPLPYMWCAYYTPSHTCDVHVPPSIHVMCIYPLPYIWCACTPFHTCDVHVEKLVVHMQNSEWCMWLKLTYGSREGHSEASPNSLLSFAEVASEASPNLLRSFADASPNSPPKLRRTRSEASPKSLPKIRRSILRIRSEVSSEVWLIFANKLCFQKLSVPPFSAAAAYSLSGWGCSRSPAPWRRATWQCHVILLVTVPCMWTGQVWVSVQDDCQCKWDKCLV